jgi:hypothetical protein
MRDGVFNIKVVLIGGISFALLSSARCDNSVTFDKAHSFAIDYKVPKMSGVDVASRLRKRIVAGLMALPMCGGTTITIPDLHWKRFRERSRSCTTKVGSDFQRALRRSFFVVDRACGAWMGGDFGERGGNDDRINLFRGGTFRFHR